MEVHFIKHHGLGNDYLVVDPNVQEVELTPEVNIEIRIWERGAGYTLASGSSACAAAGAAHRLGMVDEKIGVQMPGGSLLVEIGADQVIDLTGPVEGIFEGRFHRDLQDKIHAK
jgi:diaminopimelate epimerase